MDLDLDRWRRLRRAEADAADDGPTFVQVQAANQHRALARDQLRRFKAAGPQGHAGGPPPRGAHAGEQILAGMGSMSHDDLARSFARSVAELETRVAAAEREAARVADRFRECAERRNGLRRLIADVRAWAARQSPPVTLPGDDPEQLPPVVIVHGPPPGTHDFLGRPT
jgi:hypothetical protein